VNLKETSGSQLGRGGEEREKGGESGALAKGKRAGFTRSKGTDSWDGCGTGRKRLEKGDSGKLKGNRCAQWSAKRQQTYISPSINKTQGGKGASNGSGDVK